MGSQKQKGFTIIEVILFLAISALLLSALLVGVNTSINQQRYKDSVNSFVSLIQEQYNLSANVNNQRDSRWTCDALTPPTISSVADNVRGTTECVIVGRLIQVNDGATVVISNIVAYGIDKEAMDNSTSDIHALTVASRLVALSGTESAAAGEVSTRNLGWDSKLKVVDDDGNPLGDGDEFTLAIVRSPVTGTVNSYIVDEATNDWNGKIITEESRGRSLTTCVISAAPLAGSQQAVKVSAGNSNTSGVYQRAGVLGC